jgi:TolA-binding protein
MSNELGKKIDEMTKKVDELTDSNARLEVQINTLHSMMDMLLSMDKQLPQTAGTESKTKKPAVSTMYKNLFVSHSDADDCMGIIWKQEWIDEFSNEPDVLNKKGDAKKTKIADYMWKKYIKTDSKSKKKSEMQLKVEEILDKYHSQEDNAN